VTATAATSSRGKFADLRRTVRLFRRFRGSPKVYIWGALLLAFEAATAVIEPYPIAYLIDFCRGPSRACGKPACQRSCSPNRPRRCWS
jgi:hypothetical protein